jgi:hypothetical protein
MVMNSMSFVNTLGLPWITLPRHFLFLLSFTFAAWSSIADIIPDDRRVAWRPGIPGGIPTNYTTFCNVRQGIPGTNIVAKGNGIDDDSVAIQTAINLATNSSVVYLPAGTYRITNRIDLKSGVVLRGAGMDLTFIKHYDASKAILSLADGTLKAVSPLSIAPAFGETNITVQSSSGISVGDWLYMDQANDTNQIWYVDPYMVNTVMQMFRCTSKNGRILGIDRPIYYAWWNTNYGARIIDRQAITGAGVESLSIERMTNGLVGGIHNISLNWAARCWVKDVKSVMARNWHIALITSLQCEVRGCWLDRAWDCGGNAGYGVCIHAGSSDNLIENNIMYKLRHAMIFEWGGCGNVFGYNYSKDPINENGDNTDFLMSDMSMHGGYPHMNLFEGNVGAHLNWDNILGSSARNTALRNWVQRKSIPKVAAGVWAVEIEMNNRYENIVGNVLCMPGQIGEYNVTTSGRAGVYRLGFHSNYNTPFDPNVIPTIIIHGNYDFVTSNTVWDASIDDRSIPNSYYLTNRPSWWPFNKPWPCIGSDLDWKAMNNPAKDRYERRLIPVEILEFFE